METPVPVTARLSKHFYERLGEQVANELVDWFNAVDKTYKAELREVNELNFARFDAKVEQRFAKADAQLERRFAEADVKLERRFAQYDAKWELRFAQSDVKMEQRFAQFEVRIEQRFAESERRDSTFRSAIEERLGAQTRFMYLAWATVLAAVVGFGIR